jgi:hypothetical protein|tara:strand:- start:348 stop:527 length:180 start_codon:yes stop_codon:yes gene_type:complete
VSNLWEKDKRQLFRELYHQYLDEGYSQKEAKKMAREEADELHSENVDFAFKISEQEYDD